MRTLQGIIVSNKMSKTVVVRVDRLKQHAKYRKYYQVSRKFKAHATDAGAYRIGDTVRIGETRPTSRDKRWKVIAVVQRAPRPEMESAAPEGGSTH